LLPVCGVLASGQSFDATMERKGKPKMSVAKRKGSETFSAASYTAHYEDSPNATQYRACRPETMVRMAPHQYVNDTFLKTSGGGLLASRHEVEFTNGDELGVKLRKKGKRK
jgi:hypothetical protein